MNAVLVAVIVMLVLALLRVHVVVALFLGALTGGLLLTLRDVTVLRRAEAKMHHDARHDSLTGLRNRVGLREDLAALETGQGSAGALVCLNIDGFSALNTALGRVATLQRPIADYFRQNLYVTPSGMWSQAYLQRALELMGPERLLFSTDYPYQYKPGQPGRRFLEEAALSADQKELFAHGNWERLTRPATQ